MTDAVKPAWIDKFVATINGKVPNAARCHYCQQNTMRPHASIVTASEYVIGEGIALGSVIPMAMLICSNCGNTQHFNLIDLGVIDPNTGNLAG